MGVLADFGVGHAMEHGVDGDSLAHDDGLFEVGLVVLDTIFFKGYFLRFLEIVFAEPFAGTVRQGPVLQAAQQFLDTIGGGDKFSHGFSLFLTVRLRDLKNSQAF